MTTLDHIILKVNDIDASVVFYTEILGFSNQGADGPFTIIRVAEDFQMQLAPWGTPGFEHYAFAVSKTDFETIFQRVKAAGIEYGASFDSVGSSSGPCGTGRQYRCCKRYASQTRLVSINGK
jgi:catechol 2,3-dioxygenase-like lactoylglutathione lyase family enzyme